MKLNDIAIRDFNLNKYRTNAHAHSNKTHNTHKLKLRGSDKITIMINNCKLLTI